MADRVGLLIETQCRWNILQMMIAAVENFPHMGRQLPIRGIISSHTRESDIPHVGTFGEIIPQKNSGSSLAS